MSNKTSNGVEIVHGGAHWLQCSVDEVKNWLQVLKDAGIKTIDTAKIYGNSEQLMGDAGAAAYFTIDTKTPGGFGEEALSKEEIISAGEESLGKLKTKQVDIFYIHAPEHRIPLLDLLTAIDTLHKKGAFKRFGLSNYTPEEVEKVLALTAEYNLVQPSVYQGNYSAVARIGDTQLFPLLRKHNIVFYAYSPIGGGLLAKSKETLKESGRFAADGPFAKIYNGMYDKPVFMDALDTWAEIAQEEGVSKAELAYRWVTYHSQLGKDDGIIIGARTLEQFEQTVKSVRAGPLSDKAVKKIDGVWESVRAEAFADTYQWSQSVQAEGEKASESG